MTMRPDRLTTAHMCSIFGCRRLLMVRSGKGSLVISKSRREVASFIFYNRHFILSRQRGVYLLSVPTSAAPKEDSHILTIYYTYAHTAG